MKQWFERKIAESGLGSKVKVRIVHYGISFLAWGVSVDASAYLGSPSGWSSVPWEHLHCSCPFGTVNAYCFMDAHEILLDEYGPNYMTPVTSSRSMADWCADAIRRLPVPLVLKPF